MTDRLLELQLELLLLRHGRRAVVEALAGAGGMTPEAVADAIRKVPQRTKKRSAPPTVESVIQREVGSRPEHMLVVTRLMVEYENKTFLPQLRDVQRFLERATGTHARLKSRAAAAGQLVKALARMPESELRQLAAAATAPGTNDYELLAHEIMGGASRRKRIEDSQD